MNKLFTVLPIMIIAFYVNNIYCSEEIIDTYEEHLNLLNKSIKKLTLLKKKFNKEDAGSSFKASFKDLLEELKLNFIEIEKLNLKEKAMDEIKENFEQKIDIIKSLLDKIEDFNKDIEIPEDKSYFKEKLDKTSSALKDIQNYLISEPWLCHICFNNERLPRKFCQNEQCAGRICKECRISIKDSTGNCPFCNTSILDVEERARLSKEKAQRTSLMVKIRSKLYDCSKTKNNLIFGAFDVNLPEKDEEYDYYSLAIGIKFKLGVKISLYQDLWDIVDNDDLNKKAFKKKLKLFLKKMEI